MNTASGEGIASAAGLAASVAVPWAAPLLGAAASFYGGSSARAAERSNLEFQLVHDKKMQNTAYRRASRDMRLAGLNPLLLLGGAKAAGTGGASLSQQQDVVTPAVHTAMAMRRQQQELKLMREQTDATKHQGLANWYQAVFNERHALKMLNDAVRAGFEASSASSAEKIMQNDLRMSVNALARDNAMLRGDLHAGKVHGSDLANAARWTALGAATAKDVAGVVKELLPWGGHGQGGKRQPRARPNPTIRKYEGPSVPEGRRLD